MYQSCVVVLRLRNVVLIFGSDLKKSMENPIFWSEIGEGLESYIPAKHLCLSESGRFYSFGIKILVFLAGNQVEHGLSNSVIYWIVSGKK